uniref:RING-type E3 ubiquitin transferase n=1 Tax=Glossina austeni TaxID=7395 RepID=A0A1A9UZM7_GLOAU
MAEAVVDERSGTPARFYCYMCVVEIDAPPTDFTCPLCGGGFIEELPSRTPNVSANDAGDGHFEQPISLDMDMLGNEMAALFGSGSGRNLQTSMDAGNGGVDTAGNLLTVTGNFGYDASGGERVRPDLRLDSVLSDLSSIFDVEVAAIGGSQTVSLDNLGDNAWGCEALGTIVMQFLNGMELSGPPPLPRDKIDEIPKVGITEDVVNEKQQCSVCWEYFQLEEMVRKLSCSHLFHDDCIVPWLVLNGSCPICRKSLIDDEKKDVIKAGQREHAGANTFPMQAVSHETEAIDVDNEMTREAANTTASNDTSTEDGGNRASSDQQPLRLRKESAVERNCKGDQKEFFLHGKPITLNNTERSKQHAYVIAIISLHMYMFKQVLYLK